MIKINYKLSNVLKTNFILILIPIFIISFVTLQILEVYAKRVILDKNVLLAKSVAYQVETFLDHPLSILRQLEVIISEKQLVDEQEIRSYLEATIDNYKIFESIQILDTKGEIKYVAPFNQNIIGLDMSGQEFFQQTIKHNQTFWSPSFISLQTSQPTVTITMPLKKGIAVAYLNLAKLNDFNNRIHIGKENFFIAITDQKGNFISHYNKEKVYQRDNKNNLNKLNYNEDTYQTNYEGKDMLISTAHVENSSWRVIIYQSKDEAFAPVYQVRDIFIAGLIISLTIALILSTISAKEILLSFKNLTRKTKEIATGNYNFNLKYDSYKEFNDLAESINTMSENIKLREKALMETNKELEQFAYVASHDLKAPLRGIANLSEWIEEDIRDVLQDESRSMMDLLRGRVRRMEALIDGILQYSRVGRTRVEYQVADVEAMLRDLIDDLDLPREFTVIIESGMPTFNTDRTRLMQVFSNLISNAFKHHNRTDGTVTISVKDCGEFYEFVVTDDGPGIAPEYHAKVFEIFQTLQPRDKMESTGVGLAIVKKIIENQGGTIRLDSQEGQGVKFSFTWSKRNQIRIINKA